MIEELKLVLDTVGDLTGIALWVVGFFIIFKLIVYLSTTGAIVFLVRLGITKGSEILMREKVIIKKWTHRGTFYPNGTIEILNEIYDDVFSDDTHYTHEARELQKAWHEYKNKKE